MKTISTEVCDYNPNSKLFTVEASMIRCLDVRQIALKSHVTGAVEKFYRMFREIDHDENELMWVDYYTDYMAGDDPPTTLRIFND